MEEGQMSVDSDEGEMIINEVDGLPNLHPNYNDLGLNEHVPQSSSDNNRTMDDLINDEDLPTSIIVTNLDPSLFKSDEHKKQIEELFKRYGEPATFQYFRSFRRMRVNYTCPAAAAKARINLHQTKFMDTIINCYFAQPVTPIDAADQHLQPPALTKQFLISPPSSPPVGWEPRDESEPLVNYDLLAAIANLTPGEAHELHAASGSQPGIVVHVCEEGLTLTPQQQQQHQQHQQQQQQQQQQQKARIVQTRCPEHN